jgi:hypothetical protein
MRNVLLIAAAVVALYLVLKLVVLLFPILVLVGILFLGFKVWTYGRVRT